MMIKVKFIAPFLLLTSVPIFAVAVEPEYNPDTKLLSIPTVKIGDNFIHNARLRLNEAGSFDLVDYSKTPPPSTEDTNNCKKENILQSKFDFIANGMTLLVVDTIIECSGILNIIASGGWSRYIWSESDSTPQITVDFQFGKVTNKVYAP